MKTLVHLITVSLAEFMLPNTRTTSRGADVRNSLTRGFAVTQVEGRGRHRQNGTSVREALTRAPLELADGQINDPQLWLVTATGLVGQEHTAGFPAARREDSHTQQPKCLSRSAACRRQASWPRFHLCVSRTADEGAGLLESVQATIWARQ